MATKLHLLQGVVRSGPHPDPFLYNYSTTQGKLEEALPLYDRALAIDEKVLGDVAGDLNNKGRHGKLLRILCR